MSRGSPLPGPLLPHPGPLLPHPGPPKSGLVVLPGPKAASRPPHRGPPVQRYIGKQSVVLTPGPPVPVPVISAGKAKLKPRK